MPFPQMKRCVVCICRQTGRQADIMLLYWHFILFDCMLIQISPFNIIWNFRYTSKEIPQRDTNIKLNTSASSATQLRHHLCTLVGAQTFFTKNALVSGLRYVKQVFWAWKMYSWIQYFKLYSCALVAICIIYQMYKKLLWTLFCYFLAESWFLTL